MPCGFPVEVPGQLGRSGTLQGKVSLFQIEKLLWSSVVSSRRRRSPASPRAVLGLWTSCGYPVGKLWTPCGQPVHTLGIRANGACAGSVGSLWASCAYPVENRGVGRLAGPLLLCYNISSGYRNPL